MEVKTKTMTFPEAGVYWDDAALVINTRSFRYLTAHNNVEITITESESISKIHVKARVHEMDFSLHKGSFNLDDITEDSIEEYKPWPWSKKTKKRSKRWVTLKTYSEVEYTSNAFEIVT